MYDYIVTTIHGLVGPYVLVSAPGARAGDEVVSVIQNNVIPGNDMTASFGKFVPADQWLAQSTNADFSSYTFIVTLKRKVS